MAYIGKTPVIGNFQVCDAISVVNGQAAYTMQVGTVNVSPESSQHMLVSLNGVIQKNGGTNPSFTVSGSTITFASNLVTGDVIDFIQILGNVLDLGVPSDNTVTTAKLADSSVSLAKLTATGTKDATTFLRGDNTFAAPSGGKVLQVVSTNMDVDTTTTSGSYVAVTNFEVNITPSSTSSKVFVLANWGAEQDTSNGFGVFTLYKNDTTDLGNGSYGFGIQSATGGVNRGLCNIMYLDSPNTTSSTNYQIYFKVDNGGTVKVSPANARCTITAMEIGA